MNNRIIHRALCLLAMLLSFTSVAWASDRLTDKALDEPKTIKPVDDIVVPVIGLSNVSIANINFDAVTVGIDLSVDNQNKKAIVVERIHYSLKLDQVLVKQGTIHQVERFPGLTKRDVHVPVVLPYDENIATILKAIRNMSANYEVSGSVKIKGREKPFEFLHQSTL